MTLIELGYNTELEKFRIDENLESFEPARVISEHKERYVVSTGEVFYDAEVIGNLRYTAMSRSDFPAVGDWVAIQVVDPEFAIIHKVFPRKTVIERQAVGKKGETQIIASNVDFAFIVQAVDRDFNINRIERYLVISSDSKIKPIIVLTKTDLIPKEEIEELKNRISERIKNISILTISNKSKSGYEAFQNILEKGKTYCFLGSSGVGKSTLINNLSGKELMKTNSISSSTNKGRHVTTHRELIILENGAIVIDNPGMREVGMTNSINLNNIFDEIAAFAKECRYSDCTHIHEQGCAVIAAVEAGEINEKSYQNFLKIQKENSFFQSSLAERKKKDKQFGKIVKNYKKQKKQN